MYTHIFIYEYIYIYSCIHATIHIYMYTCTLIHIYMRNSARYSWYLCVSQGDRGGVFIVSVPCVSVTCVSEIFSLLSLCLYISL